MSEEIRDEPEQSTDPRTGTTLYRQYEPMPSQKPWLFWVLLAAFLIVAGAAVLSTQCDASAPRYDRDVT